MKVPLKVLQSHMPRSALRYFTLLSYHNINTKLYECNPTVAYRTIIKTKLITSSKENSLYKRNREERSEIRERKLFRMYLIKN